MGANPFIGEIRMFGGTFAPLGYALCNGQSLSIAENDVLYALIGTTYGGDGVNTFNLPNLQGRVAVHNGTGQGLPAVVLGQSGGEEQVALNTNQMPSHNHPVAATSNGGSQPNVGGAFWASATQVQFTASAASTPMNAASLLPAGGSQPHTNIQPFQVVNFIIALQGIYPSRN